MIVSFGKLRMTKRLHITKNLVRLSLPKPHQTIDVTIQFKVQLNFIYKKQFTNTKSVVGSANKIPSLIFGQMDTDEIKTVVVEQKNIASVYLKRNVKVDFYLPKYLDELSPHLLLINDGQDLVKMDFGNMFSGLTTSMEIENMLCVGIHAGEDRKIEYGTAKILDYNRRGAKAAAYNQFVLEELLPFIAFNYSIPSFKSRSVAGFSLGGLTAIDMVWNNPSLFSIAAVFSGSLWWRTKDLHQGYDETKDRIMHLQVRNGKYHQGLRFYFATGSLDEVADRNNNGIIDSIDDTLALIDELKNKGYTNKDIQYINYEDGRHDVETWGRAMPDFLKWGWGRNNVDTMKLLKVAK